MTHRSIVPSSGQSMLGRNVVLGAVAGIDLLALLMTLTIGSYVDLGVILLFTLGPAVLVAGLTALIWLIGQRPSAVSVETVQYELERAIALLERGLIDERDYHQLKDQILAASRGSRPVGTIRRAAFLAGAITTVIPLLLFLADASFSGFWPVIAALVGGSTVGGSVVGGVTFIVERAQDRAGHRTLSAGPSFQQLDVPDEPMLG